MAPFILHVLQTVSHTFEGCRIESDIPRKWSIVTSEHVYVETDDHRNHTGHQNLQSNVIDGKEIGERDRTESTNQQNEPERARKAVTQLCKSCSPAFSRLGYRPYQELMDVALVLCLWLIVKAVLPKIAVYIPRSITELSLLHKWPLFADHQIQIQQAIFSSLEFLL
jgi:hypothetical protein